jgi:MarR family transcriptional regulator, organic hydroperoxide resistance regulator
VAVHDASPLLVIELQRATHVAGVRLETLLAESGVSQGEAHILALLADDDEHTVGDLQRGLAHRPSTLSGILDRLEQRKLVRRTLNDADRRSFLVRLTRSGRVAARSVVEALQSVEDQAVKGVGARDLAGFLAVVRAFED